METLKKKQRKCFDVPTVMWQLFKGFRDTGKLENVDRGLRFPGCARCKSVSILTVVNSPLLLMIFFSLSSTVVQIQTVIAVCQ